MKIILALLVLFSVALGQQQVQAQAAKTYEEWKNSLSKNNSKTATKPAKANNAKTTAKEKKVAPAAMAAPAGTFTGTLPCTDCQGISTELVLDGGTNGSSRTFTMTQTYLGKPADKSVVTSSGKWFLARGNKQDPDAVVLQLIPTSGKIDPMYFLQVNDAEVMLLNNKQAALQDKHNYALKKQ